ncbi:MAG: alpha/beta fold hydrolase [Anaerolineales bacterium]|nr:alpha/beta fold hydrolase [Anaerolineales bacterium]
MNRHNICIRLLALMILFSVGCSTPPEIEPHPAQTADATAVQPPIIPTTEPTPVPAYVPAFETAACQFTSTVEADIQCGTLIVPEDRAHPERMIRLHVAVIASRSSNPAPDPVVYLNGGPGAHTLAAADYFAMQFDDILDQRDLILFDQRGVGYSEPALDCPEIMAEKLAHLEADLDPAAEKANVRAALSACYTRLAADGVNLSAYNSAASAADLDDLRQVLGYETWNLLGVSYGTRLALTAMRDFDHTSTIRSVILDSVFPPQVDAQAVNSGNINRSFNLMFARCIAIAACNNAFPDLKSRFYQLVDDLNREPVTVVVTDRETRTAYRVPFNGYDLIDTLFTVMYSADQIITLPRVLSRLEQNSTSVLSDWLSDWLHQPEYVSLGMTYSIQCAEEMPFNDLAAFEVSLETVPPQLVDFIEINADDVAAICDLWQVEAADPLETEPVRSDIPTLILSGDYDPVTPPSFAQETAAYLDHAYTYEFEGQSHNVMASSQCGMELAVAFLDHPDVFPDGKCLEHLYFGFVTNP